MLTLTLGALLASLDLHYAVYGRLQALAPLVPLTALSMLLAYRGKVSAVVVSVCMHALVASLAGSRTTPVGLLILVISLTVPLALEGYARPSSVGGLKAIALEALAPVALVLLLTGLALSLLYSIALGLAEDLPYPYRYVAESFYATRLGLLLMALAVALALRPVASALVSSAVTALSVAHGLQRGLAPVELHEVYELFDRGVRGAERAVRWLIMFSAMIAVDPAVRGVVSYLAIITGLGAYTYLVALALDGLTALAIWRLSSTLLSLELGERVISRYRLVLAGCMVATCLTLTLVVLAGGNPQRTLLAAVTGEGKGDDPLKYLAYEVDYTLVELEERLKRLEVLVVELLKALWGG